MASTSKLTQRRWLWIVPALFAGLLLMLGGRWLTTTYAQAPATQAGSSNLPAPKPAGAQDSTSYTVANSDITRTVLITGELQAVHSIDIQAPQPKSTAFSTITYLADEGTTVKKGDRIIEYDSAALLNNLIEAQRSVDEASLSIEKSKKDLEAQRCDLLNSVSQAEGNLKITNINAGIPRELLPANTYQQYQVTLEENKLTLQKAKEQLANFEANYDAQVNLKVISKSQAEINYKRIQGDLDLLTVNAPQEGVVIYGDNWSSNRKYQVGDQAFPGQVVMTLPDLSSMKVDGYAYDTELQFLSVGMYCDVHLDAVPAKSWRGKITSLTSIAVRKGFATTQKVFKATIVLDSVDLKYMKPGMTAHAEFSLSMATGVPAIPRQFLGLDAQGQYYVLKDMGPRTPAKPESVKVGVYGDTTVQILSGVSIGDRLLPVQKTSETNK
jgi:multidrug resistance efflux pump